MALSPGSKLGPYEVLSKIGAGGMGEVYKGRDTRLDRFVAIKVLPEHIAKREDLRARFEREARAVASLNHPHICVLHDIGNQDGVGGYMVMEFLEGKTLAERIECGALPLDEALKYALQIADALDRAHRAGVTHRDIKPGNIMLTRDGVKVLDFGLAKSVPKTSPEADTLTTALTTEGSIFGTPQYMAPEQLEGKETDARSDIWAFGTVLYELVTGEKAFPGKSFASLASAILSIDPAPISMKPSTPPWLERLVRRCLAKDPERRYQSMRDVVLDLETPPQESHAPVPTRAPRWLWVATGLSLVLAVVGLVGWYRAMRQPDSPQRMLSRLTFDAGLQSEPSWSPDGRFLAYSSDRSGNFEIYVQPMGEGNPVQVTRSKAHSWQPAWSPDGKQIAFRSEAEGGGLHVTPALGGSQRKISGFGYRPRWSMDGAKILFDTQIVSLGTTSKLYVSTLDGGQPREILAEFLNHLVPLTRSYSAWHPDSQRISIWGTHKQLGLGLWTIPLAGGEPLRSDISTDVEKRMREAGVVLGRFVWSPSGSTLYFEGTARGVTNLWQITVDPKTLRWVAGPERLTTGPGIDSDVTVSADGKKLAFTTRREETRIWVLPFDPITAQVTGAGQPATAVGVEAWTGDLSRDGKKLAYIALRPGKEELRERVVDGGVDRLLLASDNFRRAYLHWSPDGTRLAYMRFPPYNPREKVSFRNIFTIPASGGDEQAITSNGLYDGPTGWFADGQRILGVTARPNGDRWKIWIVLLAAAPNAEARAQMIAEDPDWNFFQPQLSPDERWICYLKVRASDPGVGHLHVMPSTGGESTQITMGRFYDDKPRWSPDGKAIFFLSQRGGFFNVWGIRFEPAAGKPVGDPFPVTRFESPARMATPAKGLSEMSLGGNRLALPITELSGSIWILENSGK